MLVNIQDLPRYTGSNVAAIGMFDGVHLGHQRVLKEALALRGESADKVLAVTFDPHPVSVLKPGTDVPCLTAPLLKEELIKELGVDEVLFLEFDDRLRCLEPEEFIEQVLIRSFAVEHVVVGEDFRFGCRARGDLELLRSYIDKGLRSATGVPLVLDEDGPIRSTRVREEISRGDLKRAKALMGRNLRITGTVEHGFGRGDRKLGFATANIRTPELASVPANGVYAGRVWHGDRKFSAAVNVGTSPTFEDATPRREVQAHLIDENIDLYGQEVELEFIDRLRDEQKFASVDALRSQIALDVARVREIMAGGT